MEEGSKQFRNEYDRFLLKFLVKNYYVSRVELSKAIGLSPSYVREFDNGTRSFGNEALDRLEEMISAKYELIWFCCKVRNEVRLFYLLWWTKQRFPIIP